MTIVCSEDELYYMGMKTGALWGIWSVVGNNWRMSHTYHDHSGNASSPRQSPGRLCCNHSVYINTHTHTHGGQTHTQAHTHKTYGGMNTGQLPNYYTIQL